MSGPGPGGDGDIVDAASLKDLGGGLSEVGTDDWGFFFFFFGDVGANLGACILLLWGAWRGGCLMGISARRRLI